MADHFLIAMQELQNEREVTALTSLNEDTIDYRLTLTHTQIREIIQHKNETLKNLGRVEIGSSVVNKIITAFCDSSYINQREYAQILNELTETFFLYKNETMDRISDDDLIEIMKEGYEGICGGSIELLQGKVLEALVQRIKFGFEEEESDDEEMEDKPDEA
ncbi:MAG: hypothetical protein BGN88_03145 [Clostridiales bacterium 43-6]|mgnify:CR=1 FL=1|nr:MAG: hypothetical protein BGN88_03145 [Clostridiales bacterium 43-6]